MVKKIWDALGHIKLSFYLLVAASFTLFSGSIISNRHFSFFSTLNESRVQDWLSINFLSHMALTWWIPLLFLIMALLGVNIFICACNRVSALIAQRDRMSFVKLMVKLSPSVVHFMFLIIMIGHLMTFTLGQWHRIPIKAGDEVIIGKQTRPIKIQSIENTYFPEHTKMQGRISKTDVVLGGISHENVVMTYMKPLTYNRFHLLLDLEKKRKKDILKTQANIEQQKTDETCNKAPIYHTQKRDENRKLMLLAVSDPGLYVLVIGFTVMLAVMIVYFIVQKRFE